VLSAQDLGAVPSTQRQGPHTARHYQTWRRATGTMLTNSLWPWAFASTHARIIAILKIRFSEDESRSQCGTEASKLYAQLRHSRHASALIQTTPVLSPAS
jgi:hypothetical protein